MPKGNPNAQTKASMKYQKKIGLIAKTFKVKGSLADEFAEACGAAGISQSAAISGFMQDFIDKQKEN